MPFVAAPVTDLLDSVAVKSGQRQFDRGRGVMSVIGEGTREALCNALPRVVIQQRPWPRECRYGGARKDKIVSIALRDLLIKSIIILKIELLCLWGEQLHTFTEFS